MDVQHKLEQAQIPAGYVVTAGLGSVPIWVEQLTTWFEFGAIAMALLVGASTFYLNLIKIDKEAKKKK